jgi:hypothetical protein
MSTELNIYWYTSSIHRDIQVYVYGINYRHVYSCDLIKTILSSDFLDRRMVINDITDNLSAKWLCNSIKYGYL